MTDKFNWDTGFVLDFDLKTGFSENAKITKRHLSQMRGMFHDEKAYQERILQGDPLVYEFYELGCPESPGELAFGTSIVYPGNKNQTCGRCAQHARRPPPNQRNPEPIMQLPPHWRFAAHNPSALSDHHRLSARIREMSQ